jgi:hypothetical protein
MLTTLYKLFLHLYPVQCRSSFGNEMVSVFRQAHADARRKHMGHRIAFCVREFSGLIGDAFQVQMQTAMSCPEPWVWSLEAPFAALILFGFCVWRAEEMGIWGFFFPGTYVLVAGIGGLAAWMIGRNCTFTRSRHHWKRGIAILSVFALILPIVTWGVEESWARFLLTRQAAFTFQIPGIDVVIEQGSMPQNTLTGLTFSRYLIDAHGHTMTMLHHTGGDTPLYLFYGAILTAMVAFWSRRTTVLR